MYFRSYHSVHVSPIYFALLCKTRDPPFASDHHCILSVSSFRLVFFISFLPRTSTQLNFFLESLYFAIANIFMHASQLTLLSSSFFSCLMAPHSHATPYHLLIFCWIDALFINIIITVMYAVSKNNNGRKNTFDIIIILYDNDERWGGWTRWSR